MLTQRLFSPVPRDTPPFFADAGERLAQDLLRNYKKADILAASVLVILQTWRSGLT